MCEECGPVPEHIRKAYSELEAAIKKVLEAEGRTFDIMTDWVVVTAQTELHQHNDSYAVNYIANLGQPGWKTKGLLQEKLDDFRAEDVVWMMRRE